MDAQITRVCFLLMILNISVHATFIGSTNDTESEDRQPRVSGRIVKLYSGTRPEPIYCPQEGFQPDPADCAVFYRCVKGANNKFTVFRFQCGPGTVYDPDTEVCNFPRSTKRSECGGIALPSIDKNNENEIEETRPEFPSPINQRPVYSEAIKQSTTQSAYPWATSKLENVQSPSTANPWMTSESQGSPVKGTTLQPPPSRQNGDTCSKDGFMGDSENCRKFYRCVGNQRGGFIRYEFSCSETTVWDDDAQSCNHPWAVQRSRCGRSSSSNNINPSRTNEQSSNQQSSPGTTIQEQLQVNYGEKVTQTQTQISHGQVIQNQTQINYGDRNEMKQSSQAKQNQTQISHGSAVSQTQTQINYGNGAQTQLQVDHTKESSQSQSQTYETTSKKPTTSGTTLQNEEYQPSTQGNANDVNNNNECTESGFMGDKNDCKKFYRCVDNGRGGYIKYEFSCGEGTVWDSNIEGCNHAWAVKECGGNAIQNSPQNAPHTTTTAKPTQPSQTTSELTTSAVTEDTGYGNQNQQPQTTTISTTAQPNLVSTTNSGDSSSNGTTCTSSGFIGDPNNCNKFYRCVDNGKDSYTKYEFNCGEGTVWDPDIEACNHPWAVKKCGGSGTDINKIETTTAQSTAITVSLTQTTTQASSENVDYDIGYGQQPSESSFTSTTTKNPLESMQSTKQPTTRRPTFGEECSQEGFMGDENDCKKFYRCVDNGHGGFTKYEFSCGEGTVWDSETTACNHPNSAKSCRGSSSQGESISENPQSSTTVQSSQTTATQITDEPNTTSRPSSSTSKPLPSKDCSEEGFVGDKNDCKKFYRCVDNGKGGFTKYEFSCGEGTIWDSEINACNHPSPNRKCGTSDPQISDQQASTEPNQENDEIHTESTNTLAFSTEQSQTTSTSQKPTGSNDKCNSEGFYGDLNDCKKFYRCVNNGKEGYTKYEFKCGDGTVWDQEIQACNHEPSDSKCSKDSQYSQSQTESNEGDTSSSSSTTQEQQPTQKPQTPPSESNKCTSEGFYANLEDCRKFYRCVDNSKGGYTKYDFSCGEGTMWVQEIQACDHDTGESCSTQSESSLSTTESVSEQKPSTSSEEDISSSSTRLPDKQEDENSNTPSSETTLSGSSDSTDKCTAEGFYPNKNDCRKFYRCVDNGNGGYKKHDFTCGEGTAWDSDIQTCNHISEVKSCQGQEQGSSQPVQDEQVSQSPGGTQTSTSGPATESSKPTSKDTCEQEGYYGNSQDCTKFYRCVDNGNGGFTKYDFDCGEGTIWDQDVTTCNHPQDVTNPSCQQSVNSESTSSSSTTSSSSSSSSESSSSTTESSSSDCSQGSTKKPDNKNVNCTKAGYYPDPDDCKKFYRCVDWDGDGKRFSVYHFDCGEGTIWDPALDTCNHEDSVYPPRDCSGGSQSQGENVSQETTESTSTTTDSGTIQESTTEQTTSQESTTSEQTTTEKTTTEQTTTEQTTTSQQTTIQQSTTSEKTTTQQSTTSEQTTTQQSMTEQSTEEQTTTQQTTTHQSTTEQSTEEQTTTEQTTTEQTTTSEQSTTQESTTQQSETTEHTTSTTESEQQSTTQQTTDTEGTTTESTTTEGTATDGTTEQSTTSQTDESGTTESTMSTTDSSTQESTTENNGDQTTESSSSDKECPETDDDQNLFVCPTSFKRHPKYCNMFYQCTEDDDTHDVHIATFRCPNNTIYDESKTQCVEEKNADKKCDGEMAQKRRLKRFDAAYKEPIVVTNERLKCPAPGHYPFEKGDCSPAFLKCQKMKSGKIRGYVYQCPQDYVYWSVSRRCEQTSHVRDCKKSHNDWKGRWEIPIERRNVAP